MEALNCIGRSSENLGSKGLNCWKSAIISVELPSDSMVELGQLCIWSVQHPVVIYSLTKMLMVCLKDVLIQINGSLKTE